VAITEVIQENADVLAQEWSREEREREQEKELARLERMRLVRANPWIIKEERAFREGLTFQTKRGKKYTYNGFYHGVCVQVHDDLPHISHNPVQLLEEDPELEDHEQQERCCRATGRSPGDEEGGRREGQRSCEDHHNLYKTRSKDHFRGLRRTLTENASIVHLDNVLDQIKLAVPLNPEEELYLMNGDMANGWGTEKLFPQILKFFMDKRRGGTLQGQPMLMRMRLSSSMLGDTYPQPGCILAQGKPPRKMGIETLAFAMAKREIEKILDGPNAPPRKDMCYVQARDEFNFHAIDIQEDFFKMEWEATHGQYIATYIMEIRNRIVLGPHQAWKGRRRTGRTCMSKNFPNDR
jgi:hypothetical protein